MDYSKILELATTSPALHHSWHNGQAPHGYIKGMACAYGLVYAKLKVGIADNSERDPYAVAMAIANTGRDRTDALSWYAGRFETLGMSNDVAGEDTLRHLFVLMTGLGLRESSGNFCTGRDHGVPDSRQTSDSAETGLFQVSWGMRGASPFIADLFEHYHTVEDDPEGLGLIFHEGIMCYDKELANFGHGDGAEFQRMCKASPMLSVMVTGIGMRTTGGSHGEWGPLRRHEAEVLPAMDDLLKQVQDTVDGEELVA